MTLKTHLFEEHVKLGAKIVPFSGWDMPVQYSSVKNEVKAVREDVGLFDVSHMGEFLVEGVDAEKFVDSLVTNDILSPPTGKAIYSPLCNERGTIIDDLIVYKIKPSLVLVCVNASNIEKDFKWMSSHLGEFQCELKNCSDSYSLLALQGPNSFKTLTALIQDLPDLAYYSVCESSFEKSQLFIARTGYTGEDGFEIFGAHDAIKKMWRQFILLDVTPCGLAARDVLRLEVCYPLYGHELSEEVTPYDAGLKWTVKMNKENFLGKSALVERQPSFKPIRLVLDKGIPREGYSVLNSKKEKIGVVTSGTMSVTLGKGIALCQVEATKVPEDEVYFVEVRQTPFLAHLSKKPFLTGGHK